MGNTNRRWLLESLLQPASSIAPHYQAYTIETNNGRVRAGILQRTYLDESTFIDQQGQPFTVAATDMVAITPRKDSLMPEGLLDLLTDQEILDLLTFLETRKSAGTSDR
jgi:putative heme-binding domain-containing protein